jgi:hypothetical protein
VECFGESLDESLNYIREKPSDMDVNSYRHPNYPSFPEIDSILWLPGSKTVFYVQLTVAQECNMNCDKLAPIHSLVKQALDKSCGTEGWTYKYVALQPTLAQANDMQLRMEGSLEDVDICIGYGRTTRRLETYLRDRESQFPHRVANSLSYLKMMHIL